MRNAGRKCAGNAMLEFTLAGIPLIFVLISTVEMSRGMWIYHTLAHAVKEGTRYAIVHGATCSVQPNACAVPLSNVAARVRNAAPGLEPARMSVRFIDGAGTPVACRLDQCLGNAAVWPPAGANAPGMDVEIEASYPFSSAIMLLWPGAGSVSLYPTYNLPARSRERIQF